MFNNIIGEPVAYHLKMILHHTSISSYIQTIPE